MLNTNIAEITIPGAVIGYWKDGRPIRLQAGGSGENDPAPDVVEPETGDDTDAGADAGDTTSTDSEPSGEPATVNPDKSADEIEKLKALGRKSEQRAKQNKQAFDKVKAELDKAKADQQATLDAIAQALGLKQGETVDPAKQVEQLTADAAKKDVQLRETRIELALYTTADKHGAKPKALQDSRAFMRKAAELDPDGDDFAERLIEAAKEAVEANPSLAATPPEKPKPAPRSGGEMPGAPGGGSRKRPTSISEAVQRRLTGGG